MDPLGEDAGRRAAPNGEVMGASSAEIPARRPIARPRGVSSCSRRHSGEERAQRAARRYGRRPGEPRRPGRDPDAPRRCLPSRARPQATVVEGRGKARQREMRSGRIRPSRSRGSRRRGSRRFPRAGRTGQTPGLRLRGLEQLDPADDRGERLDDVDEQADERRQEPAVRLWEDHGPLPADPAEAQGRGGLCCSLGIEPTAPPRRLRACALPQDQCDRRRRAGRTRATARPRNWPKYTMKTVTRIGRPRKTSTYPRTPRARGGS